VTRRPWQESLNKLLSLAAVDSSMVFGCALAEPCISLQVVDTVASLKQLLATHPAASPVRRRPDRSAGTPSASGHSTPSVAGSNTSARSAARAAAAKVPAHLMVLPQSACCN
jgi:hypothetical protein